MRNGVTAARALWAAACLVGGSAHSQSFDVQWAQDRVCDLTVADLSISFDRIGPGASAQETISLDADCNVEFDLNMADSLELSPTEAGETSAEFTNRIVITISDPTGTGGFGMVTASVGGGSADDSGAYAAQRGSALIAVTATTADGLELVAGEYDGVLTITISP